MHQPDSDDHGPCLTIARSDVGAVTMCPCGVLTVTLQYLSLRFEPAAFRELQGLLAFAQRRLDGDPALPALQAHSSIDAPPVH
ncbi:MAG: hypothetical protein KGK18_09815 [Burkholderiales bacterium]|nr:hypothetical protein [Burkholderiales bacterium]